MKLERDAVFSFVNNILKNATDNNLGPETTQKAIIDYANYLRENDMAESHDVRAVAVLSKMVPEILNLSKKFKEQNLEVDVTPKAKVQELITEKVVEVHNVNPRGDFEKGGRRLGGKNC